MQSLWLSKKMTYTGEQLQPLYNYLQQGVLGDSVIAWCGPCKVSNEHMIDGEDLLAGESIAADEMLHFLIEIFDFPLRGAVVLQRLMAEMCIRRLQQKASNVLFERRGDDIYVGEKKLNISIATSARNSSLIHFAVNVAPTGAPVPILCLQDLKVSPEDLARELMQDLCEEMSDVQNAFYKVKTF